MNKLSITVQDPADLLASGAYGTGALIRVERSTSSSFATTTEITTIALVAGTLLYEYWDNGGTAGSWYRTRYSKATPSVAGDYSAYSSPFQVTSRLTSLDDVKVRLGIPSSNTASDDLLGAAIDASGSAITSYVGFFVGPSGDTVRIYDGRDATRRGTRLWIRGGILTLTQVRIADYTGGTLNTGSLADFIPGPPAHSRRPDQPALYIDISDTPDGNYPWFPPGLQNVELTGTFGYAAVPYDVWDVATSLAVRQFQARQSGQRGAVNVGIDSFQSAYPFLTRADLSILDTYRNETVSVAG